MSTGPDTDKVSLARRLSEFVRRPGTWVGVALLLLCAVLLNMGFKADTSGSGGLVDDRRLDADFLKITAAQSTPSGDSQTSNPGLPATSQTESTASPLFTSPGDSSLTLPATEFSAGLTEPGARLQTGLAGDSQGVQNPLFEQPSGARGVVTANPFPVIQAGSASSGVSNSRLPTSGAAPSPGGARGAAWLNGGIE